MKKRADRKLFWGEASQKIASRKKSAQKKTKFPTHEEENPSIPMHLQNTSGVHAKNMIPNPLRRNRIQDRNHPSPTDSALNGIQLSAKSSGKG